MSDFHSFQWERLGCREGWCWMLLCSDVLCNRESRKEDNVSLSVQGNFCPWKRLLILHLQCWILGDCHKLEWDCNTVKEGWVGLLIHYAFIGTLMITPFVQSDDISPSTQMPVNRKEDIGSQFWISFEEFLSYQHLGTSHSLMIWWLQWFPFLLVGWCSCWCPGLLWL